jgi:nitroreductase
MNVKKPRFTPLANYREYCADEMMKRARDFNEEMQRRRTIRHFSDRPVPREVIEQCLLAAGSAPSGSHRQPWRFVVVENPEVKGRIRAAAEKEEKEFYNRRAAQAWHDALVPLGTDEQKPFLERAPYLIAIFVERHGLSSEGRKIQHYYPSKSVGIATGILLTAVHHAGLVALTYTAPRMGFLNEILDRPDNESPFLILVVGHPADDIMVPDIQRKAFEEIVTFI